MSTGTASSRQVGYLVKHLQQQIRAHLDAALAEHDVTMATYAALAGLAEEPDLSNAELARRCFVTPQTMHRMLQDLDANGLVARHPHPDHGRIVLTRLTDAGSALVTTCRASVDEVQARMLADLDEDETAMLTSLLDRCIAGLGGDPDA